MLDDYVLRVGLSATVDLLDEQRKLMSAHVYSG